MRPRLEHLERGVPRDGRAVLARPPLQHPHFFGRQNRRGPPNRSQPHVRPIARLFLCARGVEHAGRGVVVRLRIKRLASVCVGNLSWCQNDAGHTDGPYDTARVERLGGMSVAELAPPEVLVGSQLFAPKRPRPNLLTNATEAEGVHSTKVRASSTRLIVEPYSSDSTRAQKQFQKHRVLTAIRLPSA